MIRDIYRKGNYKKSGPMMYNALMTLHQLYQYFLACPRCFSSVKKTYQLNGVESFWAKAKERLLKYYGLKKERFALYLKELEFRYNYRRQPVGKILLKIIYGR